LQISNLQSAIGTGSRRQNKKAYPLVEDRLKSIRPLTLPSSPASEKGEGEGRCAGAYLLFLAPFLAVPALFFAGFFFFFATIMTSLSEERNSTGKESTKMLS
jgi:hypothetical protein